MGEKHSIGLLLEMLCFEDFVLMKMCIFLYIYICIYLVAGLHFLYERSTTKQNLGKIYTNGKKYPISLPKIESEI